MQKFILSSLIDGVYTWAELEARIAGLPSEQERGEAFEEFCKAFFSFEPIYQFEKVYRQNEIPQSLRQKLGYPRVQDIGIDGLAVTIQGKLYAYQAKFRSDRNNIPTLRELSTFFTVSDRADWRITITNANSLPSSINDRTNQSRILADRFDQLDSDFFERIRLYLREQRVKPQKKKTPYDIQQEAIEAALTHFKENNRGQLILPCGTGKTLVAMWIAEKLGGNLILVMVPSLSLMAQTLREWAVHTSLQPFQYLCLCSDTTVDFGKDSPIEHLYEMDVPVTTDESIVSDFLKQEPSRASVLLSTYQSSKVLSEAVKKTGIRFDTAIFDEAHRTTGPNVGCWNLALSDKNVPIKNRIFMTATPRIYAPHISMKAKEKDILLYSMDDNEAYGKPFYEMTFGQAIEKNLITDYKVIIICVTDSEVRDIIQQGGIVITDDNREWDAKAFAKKVAIAKAIETYRLKKIFTFHNRVPSAKAFTKVDSVYGLEQVLKIAGLNLKDKVNLFHVNGTMSAGFRNSIMKEFKESEIGIMSNARCLIEGVDVPAVDTVAFIDPKKSIIDVVQATGRALRKAEWKDKGYIFIPIVVDEDTNPESIIKNSDFVTVWEVLQAMMDQDRRLESIVSQLRTMQGAGEEGSAAWNNLMAEYQEKVDFYNLPKKIEHKRFVEKLHTKTIEMTAKSWDFWYGLTEKYREQHDSPNVPTYYLTSKGFKLGLWQHTQRNLFRQNRLTKDRIDRLEKIGFVWNKLDMAIERGLHETICYKEQFGSPNAPPSYITPEGFKLGQWQDVQKTCFRQKRMPKDRFNRLEELGFAWNTLDKKFKRGCLATIRYKEQFGSPNAPLNYIASDGFKLGEWQDVQRKYFKEGTLNNDYWIARLEAIGFAWGDYDKTFEHGFQETLRYKDKFGTPNAPDDYYNGFYLGFWQNSQRKYFLEGKLNKFKVLLLEEIGFALNVFVDVVHNLQNASKAKAVEDYFEIGFLETIKYKEQTGDANAPFRYKTQDGFDLGKWQGIQRDLYQIAKLSPNYVKRLEGIGFKWDPFSIYNTKSMSGSD